MIRYCIKRLLFMIPVLGIILGISFVIFHYAGADPVRSVLQFRGIVDNEEQSFDYKTEYKKVAIEYAYDRPKFYLSIVPSYFPDTLHRILIPTDRNFAKALLLKYHDWASVQQYVQRLDHLDHYLKINPASKPLDQAMVQYRRQVNKSTILNVQQSIQTELDQSDPILAAHFSEVHDLQSRFFEMGSSLYYPKFLIHGTGNQFHVWISNILKGDFGITMDNGRPVAQKLFKSLKWTICLSLIAIFVASILSLFVGYVSTLYRDTIIEKSISIILFLFFSIPLFWFATLMIVYFTTDEFGSWTHIFPASGMFYTGGESFWSELAHNASLLVLPVFCLSVQSVAYLGRQIYSSLEQQRRQSYFLAAIQKGMSQSKALWVHALPNALLPFITIIIGAIPASLGGALVVEVLFNIPGTGRLMFQSILNDDWNMISAILIVIALATMIFYLIGDLLYAFVNPRIDLER